MAELQEAKWYIVHTYSGYEAMVKDNLEMLIINNNLQDYIKGIIVPTEQTVEEKNGKKKLVQRKMFPCYVFVKLVFTNEIWYMVTNTRGATGFVGPGGRAVPLTDEEVKRLHLEKVDVSEVDLKSGDYVRVIEGALKDFDGRVISVSAGQGKAKVSVSMFGRDTEVDLEFAQLEKVELTREGIVNKDD